MATFLCHMPYIELISVKQVFQGGFFCQISLYYLENLTDQEVTLFG